MLWRYGTRNEIERRSKPLRRIIERDEKQKMVEHSPDIIRVMTYNIHSGINRDGNVRLQPAVEVIRSLNPDIVALQEVDMGITHGRYRHQAKVLSDRLEMEFFFYPLVQFETRHYGLAFLSRLPFTIVKCDRLPTVLPRFKLQKRGAVWIRMDHLPRPIHIFNTHLGLLHRERRRQAQSLLGKDWLKAVPREEAVVFCGDLNAGPLSWTYRNLSASLSDVQNKRRGGQRPQPTFSSRRPILRIDHIFVSHHLVPLSVKVPTSRIAQVASDHLPLSAELNVNPQP
jgi:endonuclease/exonuclease/phosphatase family metal-dependent hydrolase